MDVHLVPLIPRFAINAQMKMLLWLTEFVFVRMMNPWILKECVKSVMLNFVTPVVQAFPTLVKAALMDFYFKMELVNVPKVQDRARIALMWQVGEIIQILQMLVHSVYPAIISVQIVSQTQVMKSVLNVKPISFCKITFVNLVNLMAAISAQPPQLVLYVLTQITLSLLVGNVFAETNLKNQMNMESVDHVIHLAANPVKTIASIDVTRVLTLLLM